MIAGATYPEPRLATRCGFVATSPQDAGHNYARRHDSNASMGAAAVQVDNYVDYEFHRWVVQLYHTTKHRLAMARSTL